MGQRISSVDGLRAIAMTMVIANHCGLLPIGWIGVWLFYVISGFVITRNFLTEREAGIARLPHYASFLARRFFRIVPPYAAYIAICCVFIAWMGSRAQYRELPWLATFTENWWIVARPLLTRTASFSFLHLWTLSVEEQFYLFFPILFFFVPAKRLPLVLVALVAWWPVVRSEFIHMAWWAGSPDWGTVNVAIYNASISQFDAFLLGSVLAHFEDPIRRKPKLALGLAAVSIVVLALYCIGYVSIDRHFRSFAGMGGRLFVQPVYGEGRELIVYSVIDLCAAAAIALAISGWRPLRFLASRPIAWVGLNSYSGYLYHALALLLFSELLLHTDARNLVAQASSINVWVRLGAFGFVFSGSLAAAFASNLLIERRARAFGHTVAATLAASRPAKIIVAAP